VFVAAKETVPLPFSNATVCTRHPATARPRRCGSPKRGDESYAREKGPRSSLAPGVDMRACGGARWRKGAGPAWSRARTRMRARTTARHRDHERHGATYDGDKEKLGQRASARQRRQRHLQTSLSQPGTKAGITSGGAAARSDCAFHLGSKAGASTWAGKRSSSPWWPRAVVQASVKCGGAPRRRGGRRRWRQRDIEEVEEVGEVGVLGDGGSGSSHGWLRPSRRMALPRTVPLLLLPPFTPFFPGGSVCVDRGQLP
jgi:hypothetical protein